MPFLFPYLVGGAVAYILFVKKPKPCAAGDMLATDDATGKTCGVPDDIVCFLVRLVFQYKDQGALDKLKEMANAGVLTNEQLLACKKVIGVTGNAGLKLS